MFYVYFLKSLSSSFRYTGYTSNLKNRLVQYNDGLTKSTKLYRPFEVDAYVAVKTEEKAKELEKYFKTGSGIAFSRKHLLTYETLAK